MDLSDGNATCNVMAGGLPLAWQTGVVGLVQRVVTLRDGSRTIFETAGPGLPEQTCFVLGIRKCGSSLMNNMIHDLARINGRPFLDVGGTFYHAGVPEGVWRDDPATRDILVAGQVHGGFRAMPSIFEGQPVFETGRKILLVRDPRDALVSEYFSNAFSHALPEAGTGTAVAEMLALRAAALSATIERSVLDRAEALNEVFMQFARLADDSRTRVFRYEDVIFAKRAWLAAIAEHFGWSAGSQAFQDGMMGWADVVPEAERPNEFIRRVRPGDHREKLGPVVIERLNVALAPAMRLFGYS